MPLSNKEKQEALRKRRANLGLKRREFYLSDDEFKQTKEFVRRLRKKDKKIIVTKKITGYEPVNQDCL